MAFPFSPGQKLPEENLLSLISLRQIPNISQESPYCNHVRKLLLSSRTACIPNIQASFKSLLVFGLISWSFLRLLSAALSNYQSYTASWHFVAETDLRDHFLEPVHYSVTPQHLCNYFALFNLYLYSCCFGRIVRNVSSIYFPSTRLQDPQGQGVSTHYLCFCYFLHWFADNGCSVKVVEWTIHKIKSRIESMFMYLFFFI